MEQREIKFRVWNSAKQEWVKPIYEAYKGNLYDVSISLGGQIIERTLKCCSDIRNTNDFIISQYTGLKDKNGKEIYEGDVILYCGTYKGVIIYDNEKLKYILKRYQSYNFDLINNSDKYEIIGNIYKYPHLLTN